MVASIGAGQAANTAIEGLKQTGSQGAGKSGAGNAQDFENLLNDGEGKGTNAASGSRAGGVDSVSSTQQSAASQNATTAQSAQGVTATQSGTNASGNVTAASSAQPASASSGNAYSVQSTDTVDLAQPTPPVSSTSSVSPGDRLLRSIDNMRGEGKKLLAETQTSNGPAQPGQAPQTGKGGLGQVDLMKTVQQAQMDVTKLQVGTTILSKGVQSFDQDVQTLIKGGSG